MATTQIHGGTQIRDGTIPSSKVNSSIIIAAGSNAFTGDQSFGGNKATNVATPTTGTDAANKNYVDDLLSGRDWKESVRTAALTNINIASAPASINGVTLATNDRILLAGQTVGSQNGIYKFNGTGSALTRTADAVQGTLTSNATVAAEDNGRQYSLTTADPITVGTTALTFTYSGGTGPYTADEIGIHLSGNQFSPIFGSSAGQICQGNDSRLSDARTPVGTALTSGQIFVGSVGNVVAAVIPSGDVSVTAAGVFTVLNQIKVSKYIVRETPSGTVNGSNVDFTLANTPVSGSESVYLNGLLQDSGSGNDYTIVGAVITFAVAPVSPDKIRVNYLSA